MLGGGTAEGLSKKRWSAGGNKGGEAQGWANLRFRQCAVGKAQARVRCKHKRILRVTAGGRGREGSGHEATGVEAMQRWGSMCCAMCVGRVLGGIRDADMRRYEGDVHLAYTFGRGGAQGGAISTHTECSSRRAAQRSSLRQAGGPCPKQAAAVRHRQTGGRSAVDRLAAFQSPFEGRRAEVRASKLAWADRQGGIETPAGWVGAGVGPVVGVRVCLAVLSRVHRWAATDGLVQGARAGATVVWAVQRHVQDAPRCDGCGAAVQRWPAA